MFRTILNLAAVAVLLTGGIAAQAFAQTVPTASKETVDKLVAVLKSDAPQKEKADACRQLGVIGTKDAVPALAALLGDEKLSHMARYGLEPNPDPSVDEAFRAALGKLAGRPLVGVIGSIGVRKDAKAVEALAALLQNADADVVQVTARSLGRIGTPEAAKALLGALAGVSAANRPALCDGLFRAAEALAAQGSRDEALAIYDRVRTLDQAPQQVRVGALRGAILLRGKDGLTLLKERLRGDDYLLFTAAMRTAAELPGSEVAQALAADLGKLPADRQIVVVQALGVRADAAVLPALAHLAKSGSQPVRVAAVRAIVQIGSGSVVPLLPDLMGDADADVAKAAQEGFAAMPGKEVDEAVMLMFHADDSANTQRLKALELMGRRRMTAAIPLLVKAAGHADGQVRSAAMKRLGELGGPAELPAILDLLMRGPQQESGAAEQAAIAVCAKADSPDPCAEKIVARLAEAKPAQKAALLRVLGSVGGAGALKAIRAAVNDPTAEIRAAAIRALGSWKTAEAAADLLALAQNAADPTDKMLGLRGYLAWAAKKDTPTDQRLAMCRQAQGMVQKTAEKKLLLAALGTIPSADAVVLIVPHLDQADTRDEAAAAALSVAEALLKGPDARKVAAKLIEPLERVAKATTNADLAERAAAALRDAKGKAGKR